MLTRRTLLSAPVIIAMLDGGRHDISIEAFGARGDGQHDDAGPIQRAVDAAHARGGGIVRIPSRDPARGRYWRLSRPIALRDNVTIEGEGRDSLLFNDRPTSKAFMDQAVVLPGNYHPYFLNGQAHDLVQRDPTNPFVLLGRSGLGSKYRKAQPLFVRTMDFDPQARETSIATNTWICLVEDCGDRFVRVDREITGHLPLGIIPCNDATRWRDIGGIETCFVSIGSGLRNLAVRSHGFWIGDSSVRGGTFENISIESSVGAYGNLFQACSWRNIDLRFSRMCIELSCNSMNTTVVGLKAAMIPRTKIVNHQIIALQEFAVRCTVRDFEIAADLFDRTGAVIRFGPSSGCVVADGRISAPQARGDLLSFDTGRGIVRDNLVTHVAITGQSYAAGIRFQAGPDASVSGNTVEHSTFRGNRAAQAIVCGGVSNVVRDCSVEGHLVIVPSDARSCLIQDSRVPQTLAGSGCGGTPVDCAGLQRLGNRAW